MSARAILYARFSPRRDADTSQSNESQLTLCRDYCAKRGYEIAGEFRDDALSGNDHERPGIWDAITALRRGSILVVYHRNRLARDVELAAYIDREVSRKSARIEYVSGGFEDGPMGQLVKTIFDAIAEYDRAMIAARTRAKMLIHQKNGRRMSKIEPFGWTTDPNDNKRMILNEDEQRAIRIMADAYRRGLGIRKICRELQREGIPPRFGAKWQHSAVRKILMREGVYDAAGAAGRQSAQTDMEAPTCAPSSA